MNLKYGSLVLAVLFLAGCGKNDTPSKPEAPAAGDSGSNAAAAQEASAPKVKEAEGAKADPNVPLANYTLLDQAGGDDWVTYLAVSRAAPQPSDEEKLAMFSAKYFNEADVFKKQEIGVTELPSIQENLKRYGEQRYYGIKFKDIARYGKVIDPSVDITGAYDFKKQGFPLGIGENCWNMSHTNRQGVELDFANTGGNLCTLKVPDLEMAKKIEQLRSTNNLWSDGMVYFHVDSIKNGNIVKVTITHLQMNLHEGLGASVERKSQAFATFDM